MSTPNPERVLSPTRAGLGRLFANHAATRRSLLSLISYLGTGEYRERYLGVKILPTNLQPEATLRLECSQGCSPIALPVDRRRECVAGARIGRTLARVVGRQLWRFGREVGSPLLGDDASPR
jgi:hypothetical protein